MAGDVPTQGRCPGCGRCQHCGGYPYQPQPYQYPAGPIWIAPQYSTWPTWQVTCGNTTDAPSTNITYTNN